MVILNFENPRCLKLPEDLCFLASIKIKEASIIIKEELNGTNHFLSTKPCDYNFLLLKGPEI
jgi:hypothetical protein